MSPPTDLRRRVLLLGAQAFALGLTLAWITIPGNAIFLETFGSRLLPVTYIGAAVAGVLASAGIARALRHRSLAATALRIGVGMSIGLFTLWAFLGPGGARWLSFVVVTFLPIGLPVGFMFVVGQAGMLLDVRAMKVLYPRVIAGFALGFAVGGLAGAPLLDLLGGTEQLFVAAAVSAAALLVLTAITMRTFPTELSAIEEVDEAGDVTTRVLLSNRFVVLLMVFQMLSALEGQWLDYLVWDRAVARYPNPADLAQFVGRFSAITYGLDILFLLVIAGVVLRRFGLRVGLTASPIVVLTMVCSVLVATGLLGSAATLVFVLIVASRVSDLVLSDAATRTSVSAAYQALPNRLRTATQAKVESLGVPVAIGLSGVGLLIVRATVGTGGPALFIMVGIVTATWIGVALVIYLEYRESLMANLRHRVLEPSSFDPDDLGAAAVIDRLLDSDDPRDVRLGLDALATTGHPELAARLETIAMSCREPVHAHVTGLLLTIDPERAVALARSSLDDDRAFVRAAALTSLAAAGEAHDLSSVTPLLRDQNAEVAEAAAAAVSRLGSDVEHGELASAIAGLAASSSPADRRVAASMLAVSEPGADARHDLLHCLLDDDHPEVVTAALGAITWPADASFGPTLLQLLGNRHTAGAAADALVRGGAPVLPLLEACLDGTVASGSRAQALCTRICRDIGGPGAATMLRGHLGHRDRDVGLAAMRALAAIDPQTADPMHRQEISGLVDDDLQHAARLLQGWVALVDLAAADPLRAALIDEVLLARRRVLAALALLHGTEPIGRVEFQLEQDNVRVHALALEWLDVTLSGPDRRAILLLDPALTQQQREQVLGKEFGLPPVAVDALVRDLADDPDGVWRRPWISACAIVAAVSIPDMDVAALVSAGSAADAETGGIVAETLAALERRRRGTDG